MHDFHCHSFEDKEKRLAQMKPLMRAKVQELTGLTDINGIEISGLIRRLANVYDTIFTMDLNGSDLTGPRLNILMRLYVDELMGKTEGITPTFLSHMQNVSKNTISSLVHGLEDQGLIQRENDVDDRRIFRMKLTETGRKLVVEQAPKHIEYLNSLSSGLSHEELVQLETLLEKMLRSIMTHANIKKPTGNNS
ncbi:MAG: MarR family winged helix-turn-helix transcriptional regulator [Anaerolineaceae bacterium]